MPVPTAIRNAVGAGDTAPPNSHVDGAVLGIVGAALANFLLGFFGVALGGWLGYLIAGFIGACILIFAWRAIKGRT